jgi:hypothetical protein
MRERLSSLVQCVLIILIAAGALWLLHALACQQWDRAAILLVGLITAGVVWWQGGLIKAQIQFQSFIELDKEWNSPEMLETREKAFNKTTKQYDLFKLEGILEFLEKFASFRKAGVLDMNLIYNSNIGWYAIRYYFFNVTNIGILREKWKDDSLYEDMKDLYLEYLALEVGRSTEKRQAFEKELEATRDQFIRNESRN